jgi:hypothetical protein
MAERLLEALVMKGSSAKRVILVAALSNLSGRAKYFHAEIQSCANSVRHEAPRHSRHFSLCINNGRPLSELLYPLYANCLMPTAFFNCSNATQAGGNSVVLSLPSSPPAELEY